MRGKDQQSDSLFSYIRLETRIPADHPLRPIRKLVDEGLLELSPAFSKLYAREGRPSIPPERLLRALLLQALYTVRSERLLMEQLEYNLLFRWFVGLSGCHPGRHSSILTKSIAACPNLSLTIRRSWSDRYALTRDYPYGQNNYRTLVAASPLPFYEESVDRI